MPVFCLPENRIIFPDPALAEKNGLLAMGGDLSTERLVLAYSKGIFPWYSDDDPMIMWWCPHERYIIRPEKIHISHSLAKYMRKHEIRMLVDRDFPDTVHRCRMKREAEGTWITDDMEKAYAELNRKGFAMAVEALVDGGIAGGLYGVVFGKNFFGESMYSDRENGSKLALVLLAQSLKEKGFGMIDCQFHTDFLQSMGGEYVSYAEYMECVEKNLTL